MIVADHISKSFGKIKAVSDVSFSVEEGENMVLLGTSGCGKTTTLRMINRLTELTEGSILVNGRNIREQSPEHLRRSMGYVLQHNGLFPHYTVEENISVVPRMLKMDTGVIRKRVTELMEKLHLPPGQYLHKLPHQLSGGQQQRVGLARALAADPPVLLMDEPFGALDTITRSHIRKEFRELDEFRRKTVIMVTHDIQEAFDLANRICLMDRGKLIQQGKPLELLLHPASAFVEKFLGADRAQLLFNIVTLEALWPYLPGEIIEGTTTHQLTERHTVWNAITSINEGNNDNRIKILNENSNTIKQTDFTGLMTAFNRFKKDH